MTSKMPDPMWSKVGRVGAAWDILVALCWIEHAISASSASAGAIQRRFPERDYLCGNPPLRLGEQLDLSGGYKFA